jgi:hypothetical protein
MAERERCKQTPLPVQDAIDQFASLTKSLEELKTECDRLKERAKLEVNEMQRAWTIAENLIDSWKRRLDSRDPDQELKAERTQIEEKIGKLRDLPAQYENSRKSFHQIEAELATIALELVNYTVQFRSITRPSKLEIYRTAISTSFKPLVASHKRRYESCRLEIRKRLRWGM